MHNTTIRVAFGTAARAFFAVLVGGLVFGCGIEPAAPSSAESTRVSAMELPSANSSEPGFRTSVPTDDGKGTHGGVGVGTGTGTGLIAHGAYGGVFYGAYSGVAAKGGPGFPGAELRAGTDATPTQHQAALWLANGNLSMEGTANPLPQVPFKNTITPVSMPKMWAVLETEGNGSYAAVIRDGTNVSRGDVFAHELYVTLAAPVGPTCAAIVTPQDRPMACWAQCGGTMVVVRCTDLAGPAPSEYQFGSRPPVRIALSVLGRQ